MKIQFTEVEQKFIPPQTKNATMGFYIKLIVFTLFCVFADLANGDNCQKCMPENGAYCVNPTSYYKCENGKLDTSSPLTNCLDNEVCTNSNNICEPDTSKAACKELQGNNITPGGRRATDKPKTKKKTRRTKKTKRTKKPKTTPTTPAGGTTGTTAAPTTAAG